MELSQFQLELLKQKELILLKEFIRVCNSLSLTYYVAYGTLLGTIRHKGFIPWDDDIDVSMPFEDYKVLLDKWNDKSSERFFLQTNQTDQHYNISFAKIVLRNTVFVEEVEKNIPCIHGIFIDIFPIISIPQSGVSRSFFFLKSRALMHRSRDFKIQKTKGIFTNFLIGCLTFFPSREKATKQLIYYYEKTNRKNQKSQFVTMYIESRHFFNKNWFSSGITKSFENIDVLVPCGFDLALREKYGDYMQLPPEKDRFPHHYVSDFSVDE